MNLPNIITLFRIAFIPLLVLVFYIDWRWAHFAAGFIFMVAGLTDWLDGYLARKLNQSTPLGAFLDPVADKLIVAVSLVLLVEVYQTPWVTVSAAIIIGREIVISALREWMAELGKRASVAVSMLGKVKTTFQMTAITWLLAFNNGKLETLSFSEFFAAYSAPEGGPIDWFLDLFFFNTQPLEYMALIFLFAAALLTLWSMVVYLRAAWPELKSN